MKLKEERKEKLKNRIIYWSVLAVAFVIVAACLGYVFQHEMGLNEQEDIYEEIRVPEKTESDLGIGTQKEETVYDFEQLQKINPDIYAWIKVPGTKVDYPILQNPTDNYYLNRNLDYSQGRPGCVYTNTCNTKTFEDYNTIIYGHNMRNRTMFGTLREFNNKDFFEENRQIIIYTSEKKLVYEIYAAVKFSDTYIPYLYDIHSESGNKAYIKELQRCAANDNNSHIKDDMEISSEDKLITLCTCVSGENEKRYLIVGRLQEEILLLKHENMYKE